MRHLADLRCGDAAGERAPLAATLQTLFDAGGRVIDNAVYYDGAEFAREIGMLPKRDSAADRAVLGAFNAATKAKRRFRRAG